MSWKYLILIAIALCSLAAAVPVPQELSLDAPNPVAADVSKSEYFIATIKNIPFSLQDYSLCVCVCDDYYWNQKVGWLSLQKNSVTFAYVKEYSPVSGQ